MDYIIPIIVAVITGVFALLGNYFANRKSAAIMEYRLEQLEKKVEVHNNLIDRTYRLEESTAIQEEKIKSATSRLKELEAKVG